jgi:glycosyltransferase involved in cell wall biosynthesis
MLRVLTLSTLFPHSGRPDFGVFVERQTRELARRSDVELEVVAGIGRPPWPIALSPRWLHLRGLAESEEWKGLRVHRPRFRSLPGLPARSAKALAGAALPFARSFGPDVIDAQFFWPDGVAAMHLARRLGVPFSIKGRGSDIHFWGGREGIAAQMLEAAREAAGILAVSEDLKRAMVAIGMPAEKIAVHYTGVDLDRFAPLDRAEAKAKLGIEGPLIVSAGALIPLKGQRLALDALARLPEATLILVGDGPDRAALERAARAAGVAQRTRFAGTVPHEEVPALLAAADATVLASEREGLANAWVESLACGTPVVITNVGGAREVVDRPEAGRIVERSAAALAEGLRSLLADRPEQAAVRRSAERFSWARNGEELFGHLLEASRKGHQGGDDPAFLVA